MKENAITKMLQAYGVDLSRTPEDTNITLCRDLTGNIKGIYVETFCYGEDGKPLYDETTNDVVTRSVFYPEPKSTQDEAHD